MPVILTCEHCGQSFSVSNHRRDTARFCSRHCHYESRRTSCAVDGCDRQSVSNGYCSAHWRRVQRTGTLGPAEIREQRGHTGYSEHNTAGMSPQEKFDYYADKSAGDENCWPWRAGTTSAGYGTVLIDGRNVYGHVLSHELHNGPVPDGLCVRHTCDNPPCVNPSHLLLGTKADNSRDMVRRGRSTRGERSGSAILSEDDVRRIRARYASGHYLQKELAQEYGVTRSNIDAIVNYRSWKHLA